MEYQDQPANPTAYLPPQPESEAVQRAVQIRANLHQDMHTTVVSSGGFNVQYVPSILDALVDDAMFQIEHLLVEIEALHIEKKARDEGSVDRTEWHRD